MCIRDRSVHDTPHGEGRRRSGGGRREEGSRRGEHKARGGVCVGSLTAELPVKEVLMHSTDPEL